MFVGIEVRFEEGEPRRFPFTKEVISFGRAEHVDFRLPEELAREGVGRDHFELQRIAGSYRLRLNAENAVFLNRKRAVDGDEIPENVTLNLAAKDGPAITVRVIRAEGLKTFDRDGRNQSSLQKMTGRLALALLSMAVIGAVAIYYFTRPPFPQSLIDRMKASTYPLIEACDDGSILKSGTAWVAAAGVLVTNIHVTRHLDQPVCGGKLYVRLLQCKDGNCAPRDLEVLGAERHPAYEERRAFASAYARYDTAAPSIIDRNTGYLKGFDVALIYVDEPGLLGPPLAIAPPAHLAELSSGAALALVGFPVEGLEATGGGYNLEHPEASFQSGILSRMTDFFLQPPKDRHESALAGLLLEYDMETTGGNSGSPVFDRHGHVVAIHFSGSKTPVAELGIRVGGLTGFGVRSDAILELVHGTAEERLPGHRAYWNAQMDLEAKIIGVIDEDFVSLKQYRLVLDLSGSWSEKSGSSGARTIPFAIAEKGRHILYVRSRNALDSFSLRSLRSEGRRVFPVKCERGDFYAACSYVFEFAGDYSAELRGPATGDSFDLHLYRAQD